MTIHYGNYIVDGILGTGIELSGGYTFPTTIGASAEALVVTVDFLGGKHLQFKSLRDAPYNFATKDDIVTTLSGAPQYLTQLLDVSGDFTTNKDRIVTVNSAENMVEFSDPRGNFELVTKVSHGFSAGQAVYRSISGTYELAVADVSSPEKAEVIGVIEETFGSDNFRLVYSGKIKNLSGLVDGEVYFLHNTIPGALTTTRYTINNIIKPVMVATGTNEAVVVNYVGFSALADILASDNQFVTEITNITGNVALGAFDHYVRVDTSAGDVTLTLPNLTFNLQRIYEIKKTHPDNLLKLVPYAGNFIDSDVELIIESIDATTIIGGSLTNWDII